MTIKECINQVKEESNSNIFEVNFKRNGKKVYLDFMCGSYDDYDKLQKLLRREGYDVVLFKSEDWLMAPHLAPSAMGNTYRINE